MTGSDAAPGIVAVLGVLLLFVVGVVQAWVRRPHPIPRTGRWDARLGPLIVVVHSDAHVGPDVWRAAVARYEALGWPVRFGGVTGRTFALDGEILVLPQREAMPPDWKGRTEHYPPTGPTRVAIIDTVPHVPGPVQLALALHELGHALRLGHSTAARSWMRIPVEAANMSGEGARYDATIDGFDVP